MMVQNKKLVVELHGSGRYHQRKIIAFVMIFVVFFLAYHGLKMTSSLSYNLLNNSMKVPPQRSYYNNTRQTPPEGYENLLDMPKPALLYNYKNPCWRHTTGNRPNNNLTSVLCLPYFYHVGFPKTGTTDLYSELCQHPMILRVHKAPHWWSWKRIGYNLGTHAYSAVVPFQEYLYNYKHKTTLIHTVTVPPENPVAPEDFHPIIFGDASPSSIWSNFVWPSLPENQGQPIEAGPRFHVAHYIAHFTPNARIIVTMRNPVDREFSWYKYTSANENVSIQDFHNKVILALKAMKTCLSKRPPWSCVNDVSVTDVVPKRRVRLQLGMYAIWLKEWLKVFPREHFHFSTLKEYSTNKTGVLNSIFSFLDTDPQAVEIIEKEKWKNYGQKSIGDMLPETRALLDEFYKPFNTMLQDLLKDNKYSFQDL